MCVCVCVFVCVCVCACMRVCVYACMHACASDLLRCGGGLQQPLLLPQTPGHDACDLHGLLQVLALQVLLDAPQVVLVQHVVLLQEAAVLLVDLPQEVVEHQRGMRLLVGRVRPGGRKERAGRGEREERRGESDG